MSQLRSKHRNEVNLPAPELSPVKREHWAKQYEAAYKQSGERTLEWFIYLTACYVSSAGDAAEHERVCRGIAQIAFDQDCGVWHASWVFHGQKSKCMCAPCVERSK